MSGFFEHTSELVQRVERVLQNHLEFAQSPERLIQAMRYSVLGGGKRIRPLLVYLTGQLLGAPLSALDNSACAVEFIHCYSLAHDDLPSMDDDALRRGKPTCHIAFDEATAVLAGDALQTLAFQVLAQTLIPEPLTEPAQRESFHQRLTITLAHAAGAKGMVGGQSMDLLSEGQSISLQALENLHRLKTGALIEASVLLGAIVGGANESEQAQLQQFAQLIGLAFQVQDDVLDVEMDTKTLGKQQGADKALGKSTYPELLGLQPAKAKAQELYQSALTVLEQLALDTEQLAALAGYIVRRNN